MQYGYFDNDRREYVINRVDTPASWTNYIGVNDYCAVLNQTAGGYSFYKSPQYHRITRFRPNGVPLDRPGHYVYIRDDETGEYWSVSWQPVGKPLDEAAYTCRHGLSYSTYSCDYRGIAASQTVFVPLGDPVELWDVRLRNQTDKPRRLSVYAYVEWSYHHIEMDNQNFQMSNYASGSSYEDGAVLYDLFYEEFGYQFFTANFQPDGFDALRDAFLGLYHDESCPMGVARGALSGSFEKTGNHCAALQKRLTLAPGEEARLLFLLGQGRLAEARAARARYADPRSVDACFAALAAYWDDKLSRLQVNTPNENMNTSLNIWNLLYRGGGTHRPWLSGHRPGCHVRAPFQPGQVPQPDPRAAPGGDQGGLRPASVPAGMVRPRQGGREALQIPHRGAGGSCTGHHRGRP